jgi:hypothetical protein
MGQSVGLKTSLDGCWKFQTSKDKNKVKYENVEENQKYFFVHNSY